MKPTLTSASFVVSEQPCRKWRDPARMNLWRRIRQMCLKPSSLVRWSSRCHSPPAIAAGASLSSPTTCRSAPAIEGPPKTPLPQSGAQVL